MSQEYGECIECHCIGYLGYGVCKPCFNDIINELKESDEKLKIKCCKCGIELVYQFEKTINHQWCLYCPNCKSYHEPTLTQIKIRQIINQ